MFCYQSSKSQEWHFLMPMGMQELGQFAHGQMQPRRNLVKHETAYPTKIIHNG